MSKVFEIKTEDVDKDGKFEEWTKYIIAKDIKQASNYACHEADQIGQTVLHVRYVLSLVRDISNDESFE